MTRTETGKNRRPLSAGKVVTLAINSRGLRVAEVRKNVVTKWDYTALEPGIIENEVVTNRRALGLAIRRLLASNRIKAKNISCSISGAYSLTRVISIPTSGGNPVPEDVVMEHIGGAIPFGEEEAYLSWQPVAQNEDSYLVFVVAIPRDHVDSVIASLKSAKKFLQYLDLEGTALLRHVEQESTFILNIEPDTFDIILVNDGTIQNMHTTPWESEGVPRSELAEQLSVALELTVGAFHAKHPDTPLPPDIPLFITGQLSAEKDLVAEISTRVAFTPVKLDSALYSPSNFPESQYAVNTGIALRSPAAPKPLSVTGTSPVTMNLVPKKYIPWKPTAAQVFSVLGIAVMIGLLVPAYNFITGINDETMLLKTTYEQGRMRIESRQAELAKRAPLQQFITSYQSILDNGGGFMDDLTFITDTAVEHGIAIPSINYGAAGFDFPASGDNFTSFRNFLDSLRENEHFTSVTGPTENFPYVKEGRISLALR